MKKIAIVLSLLASISSADKLTELKIEGMMCPACVKNVKGALSDVKGVKDSSVYLKDGRAEVKTDDKTTPAQLCDSIKQAGYECKVAK